MVANTYTIWKRCSACGTMNAKKANSCIECGQLLITEVAA